VTARQLGRVEEGNFDHVAGDAADREEMTDGRGSHAKPDPRRNSTSTWACIGRSRVRAGRCNVVHIVQGKRRGLRIAIHSGEQGLLPDTKLPVWP
jgi:hypothetical protein